MCSCLFWISNSFSSFFLFSNKYSIFVCTSTSSLWYLSYSNSSLYSQYFSTLLIIKSYFHLKNCFWTLRLAWDLKIPAISLQDLIVSYKISGPFAYFHLSKNLNFIILNLFLVIEYKVSTIVWIKTIEKFDFYFWVCFSN